MLTFLPVAKACYGLNSRTSPKAQSISSDVGNTHNNSWPIQEILTKAAQKAFPANRIGFGASFVPYPFTLYRDYGPPILNQPLKDVASELAQVTRVVLGDLHGSFLKLVETLIAANLISLPSGEIAPFLQMTLQLEEALEPVDVLCLDREFQADKNIELARSLYSQWKAFIPRIQWKNEARQLLLLGDVINDRAKFDLPVLDLIEQLSQGHPNRIVWIASNHDYDFLTSTIDPDHPTILYIQKQSAIMSARFTTPNAEWTNTKLWPRYHLYVAKSQLMHYNPTNKTLYTHAPINVRNIKRLILAMKAANQISENVDDYDKINQSNLPQFIKEANRYYQKHVLDSIFSQTLTPANDTIRYFIEAKASLDREEELPFYGKGVERLVHGHSRDHHSAFSVDKCAPAAPYCVFNLDQTIRKLGSKPEPNKIHSSLLFLEQKTRR